MKFTIVTVSECSYFNPGLESGDCSANFFCLFVGNRSKNCPLPSKGHVFAVNLEDFLWTDRILTAEGFVAFAGSEDDSARCACHEECM